MGLWAVKRFWILLLGPVVLAGCSSAMDYAASADRQGIRRIGRVSVLPSSSDFAKVTPARERQRLIAELVREGVRHQAEALREIEGR